MKLIITACLFAFIAFARAELQIPIGSSILARGKLDNYRMTIPRADKLQEG
jgi:hypothetical protein